MDLVIAVITIIGFLFVYLAFWVRLFKILDM